MSFSYNPTEILTNIRQNKSFSSFSNSRPAANGHTIEIHQSVFKTMNSQQEHSNKPTIIVTKEESFRKGGNNSKGEESVVLNESVEEKNENKKDSSANTSYNSNDRASKLANYSSTNKRDMFAADDQHIQHILTGIEANNRSFQIIANQNAPSIIAHQNAPSATETREPQASPKSVKGESEEIKGEMYKVLLDKIKRLETRVGTLEIELCQAKEEIQCLRMEKRQLEEEVILLDLASKGKPPYSPLNKRGSTSPTLVMSRSPSPKLPKGTSKEDQEDYFSFNRTDTNKLKQEDLQKSIHEAVREKGYDQLIKRKEKKFVSYTKKDTVRFKESRAAGKLKVEPLNEIRSFYPSMEKPIVLMKIKEKDLKT